MSVLQTCDRASYLAESLHSRNEAGISDTFDSHVMLPAAFERFRSLEFKPEAIQGRTMQTTVLLCFAFGI